MSSLPGFSSHLKAFVAGIVLAVIGIGVYTWISQSSPDTDFAGNGHGVAEQAAADVQVVTVYHSPTCGCCMKWVDHLRAEGFEVSVRSRTDMGAVKQEHGIPRQLSSCHTATAGGYVVEGHVPADEIKRLLRQRPDVAGLSVPGMPIGSPGMEQGEREEPYDVLAFTDDGRAGVFARYNQ